MSRIPLALAVSLILIGLLWRVPAHATSGSNHEVDGTGASSLTLFSMPAGAEEPDIEDLPIESIECDVENGRTHIGLNNDQFVAVQEDSRTVDQSWIIHIELDRFDIPGGYRRPILAAEAGDEFVRESSGTVQGRYAFRLRGDHAGHYGLEMDIRCGSE